MSLFVRAPLSVLLLAAGYAAFCRPFNHSEPLPPSASREDVVQFLAAHPHYTASTATSPSRRHSSGVPGDLRANHVSTGLLFGPQHLSIDPVIVQGDDTLSAYYHLGKNLVSAEDGRVHNGVLATLLDEGLCVCGFPALPSKRGVTGRLSIEFADTLPPGEATVRVEGKVVSKKGRKVVIAGRLVEMGEGKRSERVLATAECVLVEPTWFKYLKWLPVFE